MFEHDFEEIKKEFIAYLDNKIEKIKDKGALTLFKLDRLCETNSTINPAELIKMCIKLSTTTVDKLNEFAGATNAKIVQKFLYERLAKK